MSDKIVVVFYDGYLYGAADLVMGVQERMKKFGLLVLCGVLAACGSDSDTNRKLDAKAIESPLKTKALAGDREAQFELGNSFCCGASATLDTNEAIRWWCLAAIQKHPGAIASLKKHDPRKTCPI